MVGDAQQHAQTLKGHLDKLKGKAWKREPHFVPFRCNSHSSRTEFLCDLYGADL